MRDREALRASARSLCRLLTLLLVASYYYAQELLAKPLSFPEHADPNKAVTLKRKVHWHNKFEVKFRGWCIAVHSYSCVSGTR
jgi:hypothetical protein